jgi:hypothetical protein
MNRITCVLVLALLAVVGIAAHSGLSFATDRIVPCQEIIDHPRFPYIGSRDPAFRYRTVLDVVSAPPAYMEQMVRVDEGPWRYWRKAGLVVRAGAPTLTVSVPAAWRKRAGITWGNGGTGIHGVVRLPTCGSGPASGNAYAGGFYLRGPSVCLPLVFRVGGRTATLLFGLGRRCNS